MAEWPKVTGRRVTEVSPLVDLIERRVSLTANGATETYHSLGQPDYLAVVAQTPSGHIPIVRQFRPALERFTWELPAGYVDADEAPADGARRQLLKTTGYPALTLHALGTTAPCTGRFSNWLHSFYVTTSERATEYQPDHGLEVRLVELPELTELIASGEFVSQLHIGALFQASLRSFLDFRHRGRQASSALHT